MNDAKSEVGNRKPEVANGTRGFWCLFVTQFQGAFSDNVYKFLITFLIIGMGFTQKQRDQLVPLVGVLFALPFILFSMAGGFFADRYSKRNVAIAVKVAEIAVMLLATAAFGQNIGAWFNTLAGRITTTGTR